MNDRVKRAGQRLSNVAFNLAQREGDALTARDCESMRTAWQEWECSHSGAIAIGAGSQKRNAARAEDETEASGARGSPTALLLGRWRASDDPPRREQGRLMDWWADMLLTLAALALAELMFAAWKR